VDIFVEQDVNYLVNISTLFPYFHYTLKYSSSSSSSSSSIPVAPAWSIGHP
jgi:hypothetical protein